MEKVNLAAGIPTREEAEIYAAKIHGMNFKSLGEKEALDAPNGGSPLERCIPISQEEDRDYAQILLDAKKSKEMDKFSQALVVTTIAHYYILNDHLLGILTTITEHILKEESPSLYFISKTLLSRKIVPKVDEKTQLFAQKICERIDFDLDGCSRMLKHNTDILDKFNTKLDAIVDSVKLDLTEQEHFTRIINILL